MKLHNLHVQLSPTHRPLSFQRKNATIQVSIFTQTSSRRKDKIGEIRSMGVGGDSRRGPRNHGSYTRRAPRPAAGRADAGMTVNA